MGLLLKDESGLWKVDSYEGRLMPYMTLSKKDVDSILADAD